MELATGKRQLRENGAAATAKNAALYMAARKWNTGSGDTCGLEGRVMGIGKPTHPIEPKHHGGGHVASAVLR